jgi:hypothetical protein
VARLRRLGEPDLVRRALELVRARRSAAGRLDDAAHLFLDRAGAEQATSTDVARWKARRFAAIGARRVADLCTGIGGDAIGFALEGIEPVLVDRDPARLAAARRNVARFLGRAPETILADVSAIDLDLPFHLDPDRRPGGRRTWRYDEIEPGPAVIAAWIARGRPGAVKLGPGVDLAALPPGEVEIIQRGRGLVQAVLWTGALACAPRRATRVDDGATFAAEPAALPIAPAGAFLHEVDPAVERAGLLGALARAHGLAAPHAHAGFLTGAAPVRSPWLAPARLLAELPGRFDAVRRWLAERGSPRVTVRVRGGADAREWERALRGAGPEALAVHVTRDGMQPRAWVSEAPAPPSAIGTP